MWNKKQTKKILFSLTWAVASCLSLHAQDIREYPAKDSLFFVGDRVFSAYYITGDGVIVIDPINDQIAAETFKFIRERTDLPIKYVLYSHNHWDHNSGGKIFRDQGAVFVAHENAVKNMAPNPDVVVPDSVWTGDKLVFSFGGKKIEMTYFGKNHGDGMTIFRFPEYNALFVVDLIVPDRVLYAYLPDAKPKSWLEHLYRIRAIDFEDLYMAHIRPIGTRKDLDIQIQYFEDLYEATEKAMHDGTPFFDIPTTVRLPKYEHLLNYKEWLHMNVWRILMEKSIGQ